MSYTFSILLKDLASNSLANIMKFVPQNKIQLHNGWSTL